MGNSQLNLSRKTEIMHKMSDGMDKQMVAVNISGIPFTICCNEMLSVNWRALLSKQMRGSFRAAMPIKVVDHMQRLIIVLHL